MSFSKGAAALLLIAAASCSLPAAAAATEHVCKAGAACSQPVVVSTSDFEDMIDMHQLTLACFHVPKSGIWREAFKPRLAKVASLLAQEPDLLVASIDSIKENRLAATYADGQPLTIKFFFRGFPNYSVQYVGKPEPGDIAEFARKLMADSQGTVSSLDQHAETASRALFTGGAPGTTKEAAAAAAREMIVRAQQESLSGRDVDRATVYLDVLDALVRDSGVLATRLNDRRSHLSKGQISGDIFVGLLAEYRVLSVFAAPILGNGGKSRAAAASSSPDPAAREKKKREMENEAKAQARKAKADAAKPTM